MDRDQLNAAHSAVIRKHCRALSDSGGKPSPELLADLAKVADEHHDSETARQAREKLGGSVAPARVPPVPVSDKIPASPAAQAAQAAPRRTPARRKTT